MACRIRDLLRQICEANDIQIVKGHVSKDRIHLYVSYPPKLSVSEMIKRLKGRSSKMIQAEFPELGAKFWGRHFWGIGYAAFSSGTVTDQTIQEYLECHIDTVPYTHLRAHETLRYLVCRRLLDKKKYIH